MALLALPFLVVAVAWALCEALGGSLVAMLVAVQP
jgi:hypothetical protein